MVMHIYKMSVITITAVRSAIRIMLRQEKPEEREVQWPESNHNHDVRV